MNLGDIYKEGDIRLMGGSYSWEGRVEIYTSGTWGTIGGISRRYSSYRCIDAGIACRQLGYDIQCENFNNYSYCTKVDYKHFFFHRWMCRY